MTHFKHTLALLACTVATTAVNAASVQITFDNPIFSGSGSDDVWITFANPGIQTHHVAAGRFQGSASNLVDVAPDIFFGNVNDVFMYCYDIYQNINHGQSVNYEIDLNAATARTLDFIGAVNTVLSTSNAYDPYAWLRNVTGAQGAAIQLGIWESKYDTSGWDLAAGNFIATGLATETTQLWNQFKLALDTSAAIDSQYVMVLKNADFQDMIAGDPPSNDVPEPGTLVLMGVALAGFAASRRRKQPAA